VEEEEEEEEEEEVEEGQGGSEKGSARDPYIVLCSSRFCLLPMRSASFSQRKKRAMRAFKANSDMRFFAFLNHATLGVSCML